MKKQILSKILYLALLNVFVIAQNGHIRGIVKSDLFEPLPGANVFIEGTALGTMTDSLGTFSLDNLYPGSYTIKVGYIGYKSFSKKYVITETSIESNTNYLDKLGLEENLNEDDAVAGKVHSNQTFILKPDAVALRQVNVTGHELEKSLSDILKQTISGPSKITVPLFESPIHWTT